MMLMSDFRTRMKEAADTVGGLNKLADLIGIARRTLGDQLAGKTEPKVSLLVATSELTGYSMTWLATGSGTKLSTPAVPSGGSARSAEAIGTTLHLLKDLLTKVYQDEAVKMPPDAVLDEVLRWWSVLYPMLSDPSDIEEAKLQMPAIEYRIRKELREAKAAPGTGKREVS